MFSAYNFNKTQKGQVIFLAPLFLRKIYLCNSQAKSVSVSSYKHSANF